MTMVPGGTNCSRAFTSLTNQARQTDSCTFSNSARSSRAAAKRDPKTVATRTAKTDMIRSTRFTFIFILLVYEKPQLTHEIRSRVRRALAYLIDGDQERRRGRGKYRIVQRRLDPERNRHRGAKQHQQRGTPEGHPTQPHS